jgi:hypothetical protein
MVDIELQEVVVIPFLAEQVFAVVTPIIDMIVVARL